MVDEIGVVPMSIRQAARTRQLSRERPPSHNTYHHDIFHISTFVTQRSCVVAA